MSGPSERRAEVDRYATVATCIGRSGSFLEWGRQPHPFVGFCRCKQCATAARGVQMRISMTISIEHND
jgi:hypothetical protein